MAVPGAGRNSRLLRYAAVPDWHRHVYHLAGRQRCLLSATTVRKNERSRGMGRTVLHLHRVRGVFALRGILDY